MVQALLVWIARGAIAAGLAILLGLPIRALADQPTYATGSPNGEAIEGTIYQITGRYTLTLEDERGFEDSITLHAGTIITPSGLTLGAGQVATLTGHTDGTTFDADEVDVDPSTIATGRPLLPASDYRSLAGSGDSYPAYAFGFGGYDFYGNDGYANPYASGYYGVYAPAYYYGYGAGSNGNANAQANQPGNPEGGIPRRPVRVPVKNPPPGFRYPTGGNRMPPSRVSPPSHPAAPAASSATRGR